MATLTYSGRLHNGKIELATPVSLPEGSEVYVIVPSGIDIRIAQRKANGWLVDWVGNMVMAEDGTLVRRGNTWVWRFHAYLTSLNHEPYGPIGVVDVDANTGAILNDEHTIEAIYESGASFARPT